MWCNVGFAEKFIYECTDIEDNYFKRVFEFDTESGKYRDLKPNLANIYTNFILTEKKFSDYNVDGGPFGGYAQTRIFLREKSDGSNFFIFMTTEIDKKTFEEIISKLDKIDNGELNKKLGSSGQLVYSGVPITNQEEFQTELKKYNIVQSYSVSTIENDPNHYRVRMSCKEIKN